MSIPVLFGPMIFASKRLKAHGSGRKANDRNQIESDSNLVPCALRLVLLPSKPFAIPYEL
jgi:hypothetical protein